MDVGQKAPQLQLDLIEAAKINVGAVIRIFRLQPLFRREDVALLSGGALERLGRWLMVDDGRLRQGEAMLENIPAPRLWGSEWLSIVIGLHNDTERSLVWVMRQNVFMIATALFLQGCATTMNTAQSAEIFHELMLLTGIYREIPLLQRDLYDFASAINGCQEYATGPETARTVFESIQHQTARCGLHDLDHIATPRELARTIYHAIEGSNMEDHECIILKGTRNGNWVAAMLSWLRPKEVIVFVKGRQIHPMTISADTHKPRILVHLGQPPNDHAWPSEGGWLVEKWSKATGSLAATMEIQLKDKSDLDFDKQHNVPLGTAKLSMCSPLSSSAVTALGHLATALVIEVMEHGIVVDANGESPRKLLDICTSSFIKTYSNIMSLFGWKNGDLDQQRLENTVEALEDAYKNDVRMAGKTDEYYLETWIDRACGLYSKKCVSAMLLTSKEQTEGTGNSAIVDHAIYLAGESLMFALCAEVPPSQNCHYRPYDESRRREHANMLHRLVCGPSRSSASSRQQGQTEETQHFGFWELRKRSIEMLISGTANVRSTDLAVAGNGYVAFSAALKDWDGCLTNERSIASICLAPGPLKSEQAGCTLARLTEDLQHPALASRLVDREHRPVTIYREEQFCLDERTAVPDRQTSIVHLWHMEHATHSLRIATYLEVSLDTGLILPDSHLPDSHQTNRVPTSWKASMNAVAFAQHISGAGHYTPGSQMKNLSMQWERQGRLGTGLQWCAVGNGAASGARIISRTAGNEQLRFFEAGNLAEGLKVIVRHRGTSLFECIKVAMEADRLWVIVA